MYNKNLADYTQKEGDELGLDLRAEAIHKELNHVQEENGIGTNQRYQ